VELQLRIEALRKEIAEAEKSRSDIADQLRDAERGISDANRNLRELGREKGEAQSELSDLNAQERQLEGRIASQQAQLGTLIHRQYLAGQDDALRYILGGYDPNQLARDLHYFKALSRSKAELIAALRQSVRAKTALVAAARSKTAELAEIEKRSRSERNELVNQQQARRAVMDRIADKIKARRREVETLKQDESRLTRLIDGLGRVIQRPPAGARPEQPAATAPVLRNDQTPDGGTGSGMPFARLRGQLRLPARGELINRFGAPRLEGGASWKGLFIRATPGADVKVIAPGRVVFAEWLRGFGNMIIVDHGGDYLSVYGNNESLLKGVGDSVSAGDVIASIGNSGGNSESGLYFEIRHRGQAIDPLKWVNLR
jgi:septal ring factor EnvC (AmiA/AmiB activator)